MNAPRNALVVSSNATQLVLVPPPSPQSRLSGQPLASQGGALPRALMAPNYDEDSERSHCARSSPHPLTSRSCQRDPARVACGLQHPDGRCGIKSRSRPCREHETLKQRTRRGRTPAPSRVSEWTVANSSRAAANAHPSGGRPAPAAPQRATRGARAVWRLRAGPVLRHGGNGGNGCQRAEPGAELRDSRTHRWGARLFKNIFHLFYARV